MVGPWAYGGFKGRHVDRWLSRRAGWNADVLCGVTVRLDGTKRIFKRICILQNARTDI